MPVMIDHPVRFTTGCRMLILKGRHKDGAHDQRAILRVSYDSDKFRRHYDELLQLLRPGERIYASAGERDMKKAVRLFKERQLAADYDDDPLQFYRHLEGRWTSCLMDPRAQASKMWLVDCDTAKDLARARSELLEHYDRVMKPYEYQTKSGWHIVLQPFDRSRLSDKVRNLIHENAIMLWAYDPDAPATP